MMWLYVDDVLFAFHEDEELQSVTTKLEERFSIKMLGPVRKFLEITVHETEKRFFLLQQSMVNDALRTFNVEHVRTVATPMDASTDYDNLESEELVDIHRVREALGTLLWIANSTRPEIVFAVNYASRNSEKPRKCHWELIKRIFRYLKGSSDHGLRYWKASEPVELSELDVQIWSDAEWAGDQVDHERINTCYQRTTYCMELQETSSRSHVYYGS